MEKSINMDLSVFILQACINSLAKKDVARKLNIR